MGDMTGPTDPYTSSLISGLLSPFAATPGYVNPQFVTQAQIKALRDTGAQTAAPMPVHRWSEGVANMVKALVGGNEQYQADVMSQGAGQAAADAASKLPAGGASPQPAPTAPPTAPQPSDVGTPPAAPSDVGKRAMAFFQGKGLSPVASAGLAGGFANEGTPTSVNPGDGADGSNSVGIGQWNGPRAQALMAFASANKLDPKDINTQLEFAWNELNGSEGKTLDALRNAKTPQDAANAAAGYERPAGWTPDNPTGALHYDRRLASTTGLLNGAAVAPPPSGNGGLTPQGYGNIVANPNLPDGVKQAATNLVTPQVLRGPLGEEYGWTPNTGNTTLIHPGFVPGHAQFGNNSLPLGFGGVAGNVATQPMTPNGGSVDPNDPVGPWRPYINAGQQIDADAAAKIKAAGGAGDQLSQDRLVASNYARVVFPLEHAIPALERLGPTSTGPGTDQLNEIKSFLQSAGIPGLDASKIKDFDEAKKYLVDYVNQNGGGGTNDRLAAAFAGNPSVHISNAAAVDVAKSALSLQRMQQAKVIAFGRSGLPESAYPKFATDYSSTTDPRAFGYDMMTPQARTALVNSMPVGSPERTKFETSLKIAQDAGILPNTLGMGQPEVPQQHAGRFSSPQDALEQARAAIASGRPRDAVISRLKAAGVDPTGL